MIVMCMVLLLLGPRKDIRKGIHHKDTKDTKTLVSFVSLW